MLWPSGFLDYRLDSKIFLFLLEIFVLRSQGRVYQELDKREFSFDITKQVYNLFQEPVEQLPLGLSIAEEKIRQNFLGGNTTWS